MAELKEGDKITILFEAKLESGETVLKTEEDKALEFVLGEGQIPVTVENGLKDMNVGETKTINLKPEEAFGPYVNDLVLDLPKEGFNDCENLQIGSRVMMNAPDGRKFPGVILEIKDETIKIDFNHPLAGKSLVFTVTVVSINSN